MTVFFSISVFFLLFLSRDLPPSAQVDHAYFFFLSPTTLPRRVGFLVSCPAIIFAFLFGKSRIMRYCSFSFYSRQVKRTLFLRTPGSAFLKVPSFLLQKFRCRAFLSFAGPLPRIHHNYFLWFFVDSQAVGIVLTFPSTLTPVLLPLIPRHRSSHRHGQSFFPPPLWVSFTFLTAVRRISPPFFRVKDIACRLL